jgi:hypothetical protein
MVASKPRAKGLQGNPWWGLHFTTMYSLLKNATLYINPYLLSSIPF